MHQLPTPELPMYTKVYLKGDLDVPWWILGFDPHFGYDMPFQWSYILVRCMYSKDRDPSEWGLKTDFCTKTCSPDKVLTSEQRDASVKLACEQELAQIRKREQELLSKLNS